MSHEVLLKFLLNFFSHPLVVVVVVVVFLVFDF